MDLDLVHQPCPEGLVCRRLRFALEYLAVHNVHEVLSIFQGCMCAVLVPDFGNATFEYSVFVSLSFAHNIVLALAYSSHLDETNSIFIVCKLSAGLLDCSQKLIENCIARTMMFGLLK